MKESQLESLSAKLKAKALSDEKKLLRAFTSIDTDGSGSLGRVELEAALATLNVCLKMNPDYAKALVKRGEVYQNMDEWEEAVQDYGAA